MKDIENLQHRVGLAVEKLSRSEQERHDHNRTLSRVLNDLEIKFEARKIELDHCRSRIAQLEESNGMLTGLVASMVEIVERTADGLAEDPVYRTTAAATEIINRYVADDDVIGALTETAVNDGPAPALLGEAALADAGGAFEDVDEEFLLAEDIYEKTRGTDGYPRLVFEAAALAAGDGAVTDDIDIPEPVGTKTTDDAIPEGGLDIREIMARLEGAAARAQLRAERDARTDDATPVAAGRLAGGRA